jgi:hypothetical protein
MVYSIAVYFKEINYLKLNYNFFSMFRRQCPPDFFVAEHYFDLASSFTKGEK